MGANSAESLGGLRVEVAGGIASGKTTFVNLLKRVTIYPVLENFEANPFFEAFYVDPITHAFETEVTFLLQHYHQIKMNLRTRDKFACDFSLFLDLAYATVTLDSSEKETFSAVYDEVKGKLGPPSLLVHLRCDPSVQMDRIRARGRSAEEAIDINYLRQLNSSLEQVVEDATRAITVFSVDSGQVDFAADGAGKEETIKQVEILIAEEQGH